MLGVIAVCLTLAAWATAGVLAERVAARGEHIGATDDGTGEWFAPAVVTEIDLDPEWYRTHGEMDDIETTLSQGLAEIIDRARDRILSSGGAR